MVKRTLIFCVIAGTVGLQAAPTDVDELGKKVDNLLAVQHENRKLQQENVRLSQALQGMRQQLEQLGGATHRLAEAKTALTGELSELKSTDASEDARAKELFSQIQAEQKKLIALKNAEVEAMQKRLADMQAEISRLNEEKFNTTERERKLQMENDRLARENKALRRRL